MDKGVTGGDRYTPAAYNKYSYPNTPLQNTYSTRARTSSPPSRIDLSADFIKARTCRDARQKGRTDGRGISNEIFPLEDDKPSRCFNFMENEKRNRNSLRNDFSKLVRSEKREF